MCSIIPQLNVCGLDAEMTELNSLASITQKVSLDDHNYPLEMLFVKSKHSAECIGRGSKQHLLEMRCQ